MLSNDIGNELNEYMKNFNDMEQKKAENVKQTDLENIQFLNRESFLSWARKCNITVYHEPPFDLSFGQIIIIGIIVFLRL